MPTTWTVQTLPLEPGAIWDGGGGIWDGGATADDPSGALWDAHGTSWTTIAAPVAG